MKLLIIEATHVNDTNRAINQLFILDVIIFIIEFYSLKYIYNLIAISIQIFENNPLKNLVYILLIVYFLSILYTLSVNVVY